MSNVTRLTLDPWARFLALLQAHPTIHGLYLDACKAQGTVGHDKASQRYHAAVEACPALREARAAWLVAVEAAWKMEAA